MAYYISKPSRIDPSITVYYVGDNRWTDDASQKATFSTKRLQQNSSPIQMVQMVDGQIAQSLQNDK
jgi:hypothetical protein